jgi:heptosyltransferase-2/heptosyltransferase-3
MAATTRLRGRLVRTAAWGLAGAWWAAGRRSGARRAGATVKVLVIQPDHIGDVLLASAGLDALARALPGAELRYLVGPWSAAVAEHGPLQGHVRTLPFPGLARQRKRHVLEPYAVLWREAQRLRRERFDAVLIVRPDHWWGGLLALTAGIPVRFGFADPAMAGLLTHQLAFSQVEHAADRVLRLVQLAASILAGAPVDVTNAAPVFKITEAEHMGAHQLLTQHSLGVRPLALLHPSAGAPLKSWPSARWAGLADRLADHFDVVLSGGPDDDALLDTVERSLAQPVKARIVGQPLGVLAAVLARCAVAVGPDNGPIHLAAAVGTPTVRLYGPASAAVFGPWPAGPDQVALQTHRLSCVPCGSLTNPPCGAETEPACLLMLTVDQVEQAVRRVAHAHVPAAS